MFIINHDAVVLLARTNKLATGQATRCHCESYESEIGVVDVVIPNDKDFRKK